MFPLSLKVAATLAAYRVVCAVTGTAFTCKVPDTNTCMPVGVSANEGVATGSSVPIKGVGQRALLYFQDTCASGEIVGFDTALGGGKRWTQGANTTTAMTAQSAYVGVLLGPTVALTGTLAEILVQPGLGRGV